MRLFLFSVIYLGLTVSSVQAKPDLQSSQGRPLEGSLSSSRPLPEKLPLHNLAECTDRIKMIREERGLPELSRDETVSPDDPQLIYAVDRREDGCSVLVMKGDADDIRPLPKVDRGPLFRRADN